MLIIIKDEELTENKKKETCKYIKWFKLINRISKLITRLEKIDKYFTPNTEYEITRYKVKDIEEILDRVDEEIRYAEEKYKKEIPICQGGDMDRLIKG